MLRARPTLPELPLDKARTNIGRVVDVYRDAGLFRRNDLAFADGQRDQPRRCPASTPTFCSTAPPASTGCSMTAGMLAATPARGECGIWIVRDGQSLEVHRNARGAKLEPGDEIHFGQAVVIFERE